MKKDDKVRIQISGEEASCLWTGQKNWKKENWIPTSYLLNGRLQIEWKLKCKR